MLRVDQYDIDGFRSKIMFWENEIIGGFLLYYV